MNGRSVNLETEEYIAERDLIVKDAIEGILKTPKGSFVNLAIAEVHGNPDEYLIAALKDRFGEKLDIRFIDQCGCGGYVYRFFPT